MNVYDCNVSMALNATIRANTEEEAAAIAKKVAEAIADRMFDLDGGRYEIDQCTLFSVSYHRDDEPDVELAYNLEEIEGTTCRTEDCDGDPDDGEGWNGYCGNCADRLEAEGEAREQELEA